MALNKNVPQNTMLMGENSNEKVKNDYINRMVHCVNSTYAPVHEVIRN